MHQLLSMITMSVNHRQGVVAMIIHRTTSCQITILLIAINGNLALKG